MRHSAASVNLYTGSPAINIPLAALTGKSVGVQVSLSYNASGHKVQDIAGSTGLGWSLHAGGMITRIVRGMPDDLTNGFCKPNRQDQEPDLFFFSLPGRGGKFVLDNYGRAVTVPYQSIKIKPGICSSTSGIWELVDENGVTYIFGKDSYAHRETTTTKLVTNSSTQYAYTSTWHLSEIIASNGKEKITFSYTSGSASHTNYFFTKEDGSCSSNPNLKNESTVISVSSRHLTTIQSDAGKINLTWASNREDLPGGKKLAFIQVFNQNNEQLHKLTLEYSYFNSGCNTELCKRLRLDKIWGLSSSPLYSFTYNTTTNLPSRDSKKFDHWGYYNNNAVDSWIPAIKQPDGSANLLEGASRAPDALRSLANVLQKIDYQNGGGQEFVYGNHYSGKNGTNELIGGARIKELKTHDGNGNTIIKQYKYVKENSAVSSGIALKQPSYMIYVDQSSPFEIRSQLQGSEKILVSKRYSSSYVSLLDVNGTHIGYSRVEESVSGMGKTIYLFTDLDTNNDIDIYDGPPYVTNTSRSWGRGNVREVHVLSEDHKILSKQVNEYDFSLPIKKAVEGQQTLSLGYSCSGFSGNPSVTQSYWEESRAYTLKKQTTELYDQADVNKKMITVSECAYDPNTNQLVQTTQYDHNNPSVKYISKTKYVFHQDYFYDYCDEQYLSCRQECDQLPYSAECYENCEAMLQNCSNHEGDQASLAIRHLRGKGMINVPVEQQNWIERNGNQFLQEATIMTYKLEGPSGNQYAVPSAIWHKNNITSSYSGSKIDASYDFIIPAGFNRRVEYTSYDAATGNLLQETGFDGVKNNYTWGYNNLHITQVEQNTGVNQQSDSYTLKPMVGALSATDANGRTNYTEYDALNRPKVYKDHDGNITSRVRYNYRGEKPNCEVNVTPRFMALENELLNFSIANIVVPIGSTQFIWDMANGTVYDDNRQSVTQQFATAGTYNVKLVMANTDYAATEKVVPVTIYKPMSIVGCVNGPVTRDLCGIDEPVYGACTDEVNKLYNITLLSVDFAENRAGCPGEYSYYWEYKPTNGYWYPLQNSNQVGTNEIQLTLEGNYQVRCRVTDACGNQSTYANFYINFYRSSSNCSNGTGGY